MYCYPPLFKVPSFFNLGDLFHFFSPPNCAAAISLPSSQKDPKKSASQADKESDIVEHKGLINTESLKKKGFAKWWEAAEVKRKGIWDGITKGKPFSEEK